MSLEKEQATYERELAALVPMSGKFVVIHGDQIAGTYDTYQDALKVGYDRFGLTPFLVRRIQAVEQVQSFTRDIQPCRI